MNTTIRFVAINPHCINKTHQVVFYLSREKHWALGTLSHDSITGFLKGGVAFDYPPDTFRSHFLVPHIEEEVVDAGSSSSDGDGCNYIRDGRP